MGNQAPKHAVLENKNPKSHDEANNMAYEQIEKIQDKGSLNNINHLNFQKCNIRFIMACNRSDLHISTITLEQCNILVDEGYPPWLGVENLVIKQCEIACKTYVEFLRYCGKIFPDLVNIGINDNDQLLNLNIKNIFDNNNVNSDAVKKLSIISTIFKKLKVFNGINMEAWSKYIDCYTNIYAYPKLNEKTVDFFEYKKLEKDIDNPISFAKISNDYGIFKEIRELLQEKKQTYKKNPWLLFKNGPNDLIKKKAESITNDFGETEISFFTNVLQLFVDYLFHDEVLIIATLMNRQKLDLDKPLTSAELKNTINEIISDRSFPSIKLKSEANSVNLGKTKMAILPALNMANIIANESKKEEKNEKEEEKNEKKEEKNEKKEEKNEKKEEKNEKEEEKNEKEDDKLSPYYNFILYIDDRIVNNIDKGSALDQRISLHCTVCNLIHELLGHYKHRLKPHGNIRNSVIIYGQEAGHMLDDALVGGTMEIVQSQVFIVRYLKKVDNLDLKQYLTYKEDEKQVTQEVYENQIKKQTLNNIEFYRLLPLVFIQKAINGGQDLPKSFWLLKRGFVEKMVLKSDLHKENPQWQKDLLQIGSMDDDQNLAAELFDTSMNFCRVINVLMTSEEEEREKEKGK